MRVYFVDGHFDTHASSIQPKYVRGRRIEVYPLPLL